MYVVTQYDQVLLGPINFNTRLIMSVVEDDTETIINLLPSMESHGPIQSIFRLLLEILRSGG